MRTRLMLCPSLTPSCPSVPTQQGEHKLKVGRGHFLKIFPALCAGRDVPLTFETVSAPLSVMFSVKFYGKRSSC